jgi:hypothetical protein
MDGLLYKLQRRERERILCVLVNNATVHPTKNPTSYNIIILEIDIDLFINIVNSIIGSWFI